MKIILYTYDILKIGGIETSFFNFAQWLKDQGHEVGVRYSIVSPIQVKRYKEAGIDIQREKAELCDILFIGSIWHQPVKIGARLTVQQIHADWSDKFWKGGGSAMQMIAKADKRVDIYTAVSESSSSFVKKCTDKKVLVMNNLAPNKTEVIKKKHKKLVLAAFTRMTEEKGLNNYIALRDHIESMGIDAEFRVYTNGQAPEGWKLYEPVPDIKSEFNGIDFVCSLADTESFGYTIAEANSAGIPCIIKRSNSTLEFFNNKDNVIVDDVTEVTEKSLRRKIKNYTLRDQTEDNIKDTLETLMSEYKQKYIIRARKPFNDLLEKKKRYRGEVFSVTKGRAKELLKHKLNLVEEL